LGERTRVTQRHEVSREVSRNECTGVIGA
jgi:hypothetical protein